MNYLSIEQAVDSARNDVADKVKKGLFRGYKDITDDNQENVHTIVSLYAQWCEDAEEAEDEIISMIKDEFGI